MSKRIIEHIREKVQTSQYDMTRHTQEEMSEDGPDLFDVEQAIFNGKLVRKEKDDLRGIKYTVAGKGTDQQTDVGVVGRFTETGRFLVITVYEIKDF